MMRRRLLPIMILSSFFAVVVNQTFGQNPPTADERVPAGNWRVALVPYSGPEFDSMPLQVISVVAGASSHDGNSFWIREKRLRNRSDKRVLKASFTAFVYREESPDKLLFQHPLHTVGYSEVPVLAGTEWPAPCRERPKYCPYGHAIPGATMLLGPLIKDATLDGEYRIAIGVSKVWFEDGSTWELPGNPTNAQPKVP